MNKRRFTVTPVGGSTLIVFLAVLTLVTFAILSLSTATADLRLTDSMVESNIAYYEADCRGEQILSSLRQGTVPEQVSEIGNGRFEFEIPITDSLYLAIEVSVNSADGTYIIHRWQEVNKRNNE